MFKHPRKYWAIVALIFIALIPSQSYTKDHIDGPGIASAHPMATQAGLKIWNKEVMHLMQQWQ